MIQQLKKNQNLLWSDIEPEAIVVEMYNNNFISFQQQDNVLEIRVEQIDELIKILKEFKKQL